MTFWYASLRAKDRLWFRCDSSRDAKNICVPTYSVVPIFGGGVIEGGAPSGWMGGLAVRWLLRRTPEIRRTSISKYPPIFIFNCDEYASSFGRASAWHYGPCACQRRAGRQYAQEKQETAVLPARRAIMFCTTIRPIPGRRSLARGGHIKRVPSSEF